MEKVWNDFDLKKPPFITISGKYSHFVIKLHATIGNYFSNYVQYEQEFNETAALLSRLMARRKNSFSKMKGFRDICKLNAALSRLLRVDFKRDLDSFRNTLPDVDYEEGTSIYMPTRDSLDYLLMRLLAIYELYRRICDCCTSAAEYFTSQIRLYFFFEISTLFLAVLAKIHSISIKLLNAATDLYNNTLPYRLKFPVNPKSNSWAGANFEFPKKLEKIKINALESESIASKDQPLKALCQQEQQLGTVKAKKLKKIDTGIQIARNSKPLQKTVYIEKLCSVEEIKVFISKESQSRSKNVKGSITAKILSHEWAGATKLFERKLNNGEEKKAVNIFRKFLSLKM